MSRSAKAATVAPKIEELITGGDLRHSLILKALPDLVFIIQSDGTYLEYHARDERELLVPPQDFLGRNVRDVMPAEIAEKVFHAFDEARNSDEAQCIEYELTVNGFEQYFECRIVTAGPDKFLSIVRNVTANRRTLKYLEHSLEELHAAKQEVIAQNQELADSREAVELERTRFRELFEFAPDAYVVTDKYGIIRDSNHAAGEILQSPPDRQKGFPLSVYIAAPDRQVFTDLRSSMSDRTSGELDLRLGDGNRYASIKVNRIDGDANGNLRWLIRDTTLQRQAETALAESELFNRRIIESSNDCIKILDLDGNLLYINPQGRRLMELDEHNACIGNHWPEFWNDAYRSTLLIELEKARSGMTGRFEGEAKTFKGTTKWWDVMITPIAGVQRNVDRLLVISRDITEQKTAAEKLLVKQRFFRSLIENAHDVITVLDLQGHLIYESPACERIFGYGPEERIGVNCFEYLHENDRERVSKIFSDAVCKKGSTEPTEYRYRHKNGSWVIVEVIAKYSHDESGASVMIINKRDITDRRRAQKALAVSEEKYRQIVDTMHEGIWVLDAESKTTLVNRQLAEMLGYSVEEMEGRPSEEFLIDGRQTSARRKKKNKNEGRRFEATLIRKDGTTLKALVSSTSISTDGSQPGTLAILMDVTERMRTHEQLERLTAQLLNLQDEERRRIARELHDGTAQNLAAIGINLSAVKQLSTSNGRVGKILDQTRDLTETALQEIRTMSYLLHPPMLEEAGLVSALRWFIDGYTDRTGITVDLQISKQLGRLPRGIETAIYRIVQEGLNNVYRHSGSEVASIYVGLKRSDVVVKIRDKGHGLPNGSRVDSGVGIRGMKERLRLLGGNFDIVSGKSGTTLTGVIPLGMTK